VFGPVFRYFDVFDEIADFGILAGKPKLARWRKALAVRPSVRTAVSTDYPALLRAFLDRRDSWITPSGSHRRLTSALRVVQRTLASRMSR
jgi:glutathione S-transferase